MALHRQWMIILLLGILMAWVPLHAGSIEFRGIALTTGVPVEPLVERLGEPTSTFREEGCDCAGCRIEETFFYRDEERSLTLIARDGVLFSIR